VFCGATAYWTPWSESRKGKRPLFTVSFRVRCVGFGVSYTDGYSCGKNSSASRRQERRPVGYRKSKRAELTLFLAMASAEELTMRRATKDDLDHLLEVANLKTGTGKNITGDGGDYVREAWLEDWWTHDPRTHYEEFAFVGGLPVGFARCDCYGPPDDSAAGAPDAGPP
jgi:hypothetical protein